MKRIYLDYAAATPVDERVKEAMEPFWSENFGNPGGLHEEGVKAKQAVEEARKKIARELGVKAEEIIFTASGTESCNLAILGAARQYQARGKHLITSRIEHQAVLQPFKLLEREGFEVTYLGVGAEGIVSPEELLRALRPDTILASVMYANNEIGTIQPLYEIGKILKEHQAYFHTDACQAVGYLNLNPNNLGADLMSFSGYKFYGPKGIGFLYKARNVLLEPPVVGGEQEFGLRPGTENVAAIVGMAKALELSKFSAEELSGLKKLRDYFIDEILEKIPEAALNGERLRRLPTNVNISFKNVDNEELVLRLDAAGVAVATGSACRREASGPSHVITALGREPEYAAGAIRFSFGRRTTKAELDYVLAVLPEIIARLK